MVAGRNGLIGQNVQLPVVTEPRQQHVNVQTQHPNTVVNHALEINL